MVAPRADRSMRPEPSEPPTVGSLKVEGTRSTLTRPGVFTSYRRRALVG